MTHVRARPGRLARGLATLIRGDRAASLRGDLEESFLRRADRVSLREARRAHLVDVVASLLRWWTPRAVRVRRRLSRPRSPTRTTRGTRLGELPSTIRGLARRPGFCFLVISTLGLGIGATTTIFSVVDGILIRSIPHPDADRLVAFGATFPNRAWREESTDLMWLAGMSVGNYVDWKARVRSLDRMAVVEVTHSLLADGANGPELVGMASVTDGFFELLQVRPHLGRMFLPDDYTSGTGPVALLSFESWQSRYGANPEIIGRGLDRGPVGDRGVTIVGVLPQGFRPPEAVAPRVEWWSPLNPSSPRYVSRGRRSVLGIGRLAPDATVETARAELAVIQESVAQAHPEGNDYPEGGTLGAGVNSLHAETVGSSGRLLLLFFAASGLLLVIAGINAANLLFVRGLDREGEVALRLALGAGRGRVIGMVLLESVVLALLGGALGAVLAVGGVGLFRAYAPSTLPRLADVAVSWRVLGMSALLSIGTGVMAGLLPALRQGGGNLLTGIREGLGMTTAPRGMRLRNGLIAVQLALALMLGVGASLLFRSFVELRTVDPGFVTDRLAVFGMPLKLPGETRAPWQLWDDLAAAVQRVPGVEAVAIGSNLPFQSPNWAPRILLPGEASTTAQAGVAGYAVAPGYFSTLGIPIRRGRPLGRQDGPGDMPVAVVNEAFVQARMVGQDPVGARVRQQTSGDSELEVTVVGVVGNAVQTRVEEGFQPAIYFPIAQSVWGFAHVAARSARRFEALGPELRRAAASVSTVVPIMDLATMDRRIASAHTAPRFQTMLIGGFAIVAILLAAIGLYGTMAHAVGHRTRELGIRIAVGADTQQIFRMVVLQGLAVAGAGLALGLAGAAVVTRYLASLLYAVDPLDLVTFSIALLVLIGVATAAVLRPALHATRVDPVGTLRAES